MRLRPIAIGLTVVATGGAVLGMLALYTDVETRRAEAAFPPAGRFVSVGSVRLRYRDAGTGPPVVLLHGNPGFLDDFAPDEPDGVFALLARQFHVVAIDRPGHGYSERPSAAGTTPHEQARLLHDALGQLGVARPVLVGHSWGGGLALVYTLEHPDDVRGLVLLGTRAYRDSGRADPVYALNRLRGIGALLRATVMLPVGRRLVDQRLAAAYAPDQPDPRHVARARGLWLRPSQIAATVWDTPNLQEALGLASGRYAEIGVPAAIVVGDGDRGIAESRAVARALPCAELVVVPATGHELPLTRPGVVAAAVRRVAGRAACGP
jgi:pimeloyl-ACP methyl ester carboxylesterase